MGEAKSSDRLGAAGKLVILETVIAFISAALDLGKKENALDGWIESEVGKGKGKQRTVGSQSLENVLEQGWLVGIGDWGVSDSAAQDCEIGRLASGDGDNGDPSDVVLAVSP